MTVTGEPAFRAAQVEFSRASVCRMCLDTGFSYNKYEREFMPDG